MGPYGVTMSLDLWLMAEWLHEELVRLHERLDQMTDVVVQQEDLDTMAQQINESVTALQTQISTLEAAAANPAEPVQLPAGSLDGLKAAVSDLQGLETPATTPVPEPAPAPPGAAAPPDQALPPA